MNSCSLPPRAANSLDSARTRSAHKPDFVRFVRLDIVIGAVACALCMAVAPSQRARPRSRCPGGSVPVDGRFCVDRYEGSLREVIAHDSTRAWSPFEVPREGSTYRAVSRHGVVPQGYISQLQARAACAHAGKRLCTETEWTTACRGPHSTTFPYGNQRTVGRCNDSGDSPVLRLSPPRATYSIFGR